MDIKLLLNYSLLFLLLASFNCCYADTMYTQSLSSESGEPAVSNSYASYTNKELPQLNPLANNTNNTNSPVTPIVIDTNNLYYPSYPYYNYNRYPAYRIGPYYSSGISIGGFNYKGFGYNYSSGKRPIYINHPLPPQTPPNWHRPNGHPSGMHPPNNGHRPNGQHPNRPPHKPNNHAGK